MFKHISLILPDAMHQIQINRFRRIIAGYNQTGSCGHLILDGDAVGWDRDKKQTLCRDCFSRAKAKEAAEKQGNINETLKVG